MFKLEAACTFQFSIICQWLNAEPPIALAAG